MSERTCDLCGWVIEEWQRDRYIVGDGWAHRNPADCKPTREPVADPVDLPEIEVSGELKRDFVGGIGRHVIGVDEPVTEAESLDPDPEPELITAAALDASSLLTDDVVKAIKETPDTEEVEPSNESPQSAWDRIMRPLRW